MSLEDRSAARPTAAIQLSRVAVSAARGLLGLVLLAMVVLNVGNAIGRYAFGAVMIGSDEVLVFGMVWMVMIGMPLTTAERGHIALDVMATRVTTRTRVLLSLAVHSVMTLGCGYATLQSFFFVQRITAMGQTSMALGIPMLVPHSALIVGFGGSAIIAAVLVASDAMKLASDVGVHGRDRP